jgi:hypothetical protein
MKQKYRFKRGDLIICKMFPGVVREIVKKEGKYWLWKYRDRPTMYTSGNSNDPKLQWWELKTN